MKSFYSLISLFYSTFFIINAQEVSTFAGSSKGYFDDIGINAKFGEPNGICADSNGNLYIVDTFNKKIRKVDILTNQVTTLAGSSSGYLDGIGTSAKFNGPTGICIDQYDNLYIADSGNNKIRKIVVSTGEVSTIAGSSFGFNNGIGTTAKFSIPVGICTDNNGFLYVADFGNNQIRKIEISTTNVTTLVGSTSGYSDGFGTNALFNNPQGICSDMKGNLYVTDSSNHKIRKINSSTAEVNTIAGSTQGFFDGIGALSQFNFPYDLCIDNNDNLFVTDNYNHKIRKINTKTNEVTTIAGSSLGYLDGIASTSQFKYPSGICYNQENFYVSDQNNYIIRKISNNLSIYNQEKLRFKIFPNPCTFFLEVEIDNITSNTRLQITDVLGKIIQNQKLESSITKINTSSFSKGIYFLKISDENKKSIRKFIVK